MKLADLKIGDNIYSVSMGDGVVTNITPEGAMINHGGRIWGYNKFLVRSGCNQSDLVYDKRKIYLDASQKDIKHLEMINEISKVVLKYAN